MIAAQIDVLQLLLFSQESAKVLHTVFVLRLEKIFDHYEGKFDEVGEIAFGKGLKNHLTIFEVSFAATAEIKLSKGAIILWIGNDRADCFEERLNGKLVQVGQIIDL